MKVLPILLVFFSLRLWGQPLALEQITIADGLSQGMIHEILQTQDGFLWFATKDGLNRYDGYEFKVFTNDPFDPWSIADNMVMTLFEDSNGYLWIGTQNKGLDLYDAEHQRFYHFRHQSDETIGLKSNNILSITEDPSGALWVLQRNRHIDCFRLDGDLPNNPDLSTSVKIIEHNVQFPGEQANYHSFHRMKNGKLWVEHDNDLLELEWEKGFLQAISMPPTLEGRTEVRSFAEDDQGDLWLGRSNELTYLSEGQTFHIPFPKEDVGDILFDQFGNAWLKLAYSIWKAVPSKEVGKPPMLQKIISADRGRVFTRIRFDKTGILWIGTGGYGVFKFNPRVFDFTNFISKNSIWSLYQDHQDRTWVKWLRKYYLLDKEQDTLIEPDFWKKYSTYQKGVLLDKKNRMWVISMGENYRASKFTLLGFSPDLQLVDSVEVESELGLSTRMCEDGNGHIWIGANDGVLIQYNPFEKKLTTYNYAHLFPFFEEELEAVALASEADNVLWVGTRHGLVKGVWAEDSLQFSAFTNNPQDRKSIANSTILSIYPEPKKEGKIWLGTNGGIGCLDRSSNLFHFFTTKDGLPSNVVYGILPDENGRLWLSTNRGISCMNIVEEKGRVSASFKNYGIGDGLPGLEFNTSAFARSTSGDLLFGGVEGLTIFNPNDLTVNDLMPPIYITGIEVNNQKIEVADSTGLLEKGTEAVKSIVLRYDQNLISLRYAALDYTAPNYNQYRYRLIGADPDWVEAGTRNRVTYSHLRPGSYQFEVQGSNSDGVWSQTTAQLKVIVLPPWWETWWAYSIYVVMVLGTAWWFYRTKIKEVKLENQVLFEKKEAERLAEVGEMKTNFFNSVTHEFRTPLTLIIEPLRQLLKNPDDPDRGKKIYLAEKNSHRLLHLVNQLLDTAKLQSGNMALHQRRGNFQKAVQDTFEHFLPLAEKKGIALEFSDLTEDLPEFDFDPDKIEILLNNLLSNALKFTPSGGQVSIKLVHKTNLQEQNGSPESAYLSAVEVQVSDTGIGIAAADLEKVFDRFYQADNHLTRVGEGTGIGLSLSKELAELMGGRIAVASELGKGSTFVFWLPIKNGSVQIPMKSNGQEVADFSESKVEKYSSRPIFSDERPLVLLVEDNAELREFIKQSIGEGWEIVEAVNGEEGFKKAVEIVPELIISDVMMPLKDGYDLCDELKRNELTAHVPIILLTAKSAIESKLKGLRIGADDYLTKPFYTEELVTRMQNLVEMRRKLRDFYGKQPIGETLKPSDNMSALDREFLQKFTQLLEDNLTDDSLGVEDFSKKMFLSRSQLHRKLKAITDRNATEFIRDFRLERAYVMLAKGDGLVGEIAFQVGFSNEKYFSTVFKEKYGMPPSQVLQR